MMNINDLIKQAQEITASGLPFMEGKVKLEVKGDVFNRILTVSDYGFLEGEEGVYVVIAVKEYPQNFIYGSSVVTQAFQELDTRFTGEQKGMIIEQGLTFTLSEMVSKNKRKYTKINFFPGY